MAYSKTARSPSAHRDAQTHAERVARLYPATPDFAALVATVPVKVEPPLPMAIDPERHLRKRKKCSGCGALREDRKRTVGELCRDCLYPKAHKTCLNKSCGTKFTVTLKADARGKGRFCSKECGYEHRRNNTEEYRKARLQAKIDAKLAELWALKAEMGGGE